MGTLKIDIVQYADDITLIVAGLQKQIDVCNEYGKEYGIQFNPDKTTIMEFNTDCVRSIDEIEKDAWQGPFKFAEITVEITSTMKILGQILAQMFKTCVRPVLTSGIVNMELNGNELLSKN